MLFKPGHIGKKPSGMPTGLLPTVQAKGARWISSIL